MAEALARGLLSRQVFKPSDLIASDVDPARRRKLSRGLRVRTTADNREVVAEARAIVLAVKPQMMDAVLDELGEAIRAGERAARAAGSSKIRGARSQSAQSQSDRMRLFISIAAGVPIARIERALGP